MTTYANRGMNLESLIEYANARYRANGVAIVEKQNTKFIPLRNQYTKQINSCKVEKKATVDFMGRYKTIPVAIEAKHTKTNRIRFDAVQNHQAEFLTDFCKDEQGFGAVLVSYNMERFFLVPWEFWKAGRTSWEKYKGKYRHAVMKYGVDWKPPGKASVSADELPQEFEVKINNKYGLAYLSKIDTYIAFRNVSIKKEV